MWRYILLIFIILGLCISFVGKAKKTDSRVTILPATTSTPVVKDYTVNFPESSEYIINVNEFPLDKKVDSILNLVPQNTDLPRDIKNITLYGFSITKASYDTFDLKQFYELGEKRAQKWTSYGYVINLPTKKLFLYFSSRIHNDKWAEKNIIGNLKVSNKL